MRLIETGNKRTERGIVSHLRIMAGGKSEEIKTEGKESGQSKGELPEKSGE